jgi:uncharacterized lipoprotein YddW (UPF0748 family)
VEPKNRLPGIVIIKKTVLRVARSATFFIIISLSFSYSQSEPPWITDLGLWIVRDALTTSSSVDEIIRYAVENNYSQLFLQIRGRGDAYYSSKIVPVQSTIKKMEFDPLSRIINQAHEAGINVHAWINVYMLWSSPELPLEKNHLLYQQPDWIDDQFSSNKSNDIQFLAPHNPSVNQYLIRVIDEILRQYDLDGIHLDYIRFQDKDFGYNISAVADFLENNTVNHMQNVLPGDEKWEEFKRNSITTLISQIKTLRDQKYPELILSAAVKPNLKEAKERFGQDWSKWLIDGMIDWAVVMNYLPDSQIFADNLDVIRENFPNDLLSKIYIGIATYNQTHSEFFTKVMYTSCSNFSKFSVFSYNNLLNQPDYSDKVTQIFSK